MKKKILFISIIVIIISVFLFLASRSFLDKNILWARNLDASDIKIIEAIRYPSHENERYRIYFDNDDFVRILETVNDAKGLKISNPESLSGGGTTFFITLTDGTRRTFANNGNIYLVIDGISYKSSYNWLSSWPYEHFNAKIPDYFNIYESTETRKNR